MNRSIFLILAFFFFSSVVLLIDNYYLLGEICFYTILLYTGFYVIIHKEIRLIDVWNIAFLFIILSELFVSETIDNSYISPIRYLLLSNNVVNIGYLTLGNKQSSFSKKSVHVTKKVRDHRVVSALMIGVMLLYSLLRIQDALHTFAVGRNVVISEGAGRGFFLDSILDAIGFILPAILCYYYIYIRNKSFWTPFILSLPIFIILFLGGTRFPLLFSLLGFFIVYQSKFIWRMSIKHYIFILVAIIGLGYIASLMKHFRSSTTKQTEFSIFQSDKIQDLPTLLSTSIMSPEGVIDMTSLLFDYFQKNDYLYGSSSSFIFYFWIPRELWPDKPTMLGHWLIRGYRGGIAEGHSSSFGFTGDLYADFGLFSLMFVFLIGRLLKVAENFKNAAFKLGGYNLIIGAMLFPYTFFFVRSPITATMTFLGILFFYYVFKYLIFRK